MIITIEIIAIYDTCAVCTKLLYRLGVQPVLITEINLGEEPKQGINFFTERISAPSLECSKGSNNVANCYGLYMSSKASDVYRD